MNDFSGRKTFSFSDRPSPVPGDLRINWRVSLILLIALSSRMNRVSLAKMHVLTEAVRSPVSFQLLQRIIAGLQSPLDWPVRVEPALARAVDLTVDDRLAIWTNLSGRIGIELTSAGIAAAKAVKELPDTMVDERECLDALSFKASEALVTRLISNERLL